LYLPVRVMENPLTGGKAEQDKFLDAIEDRTGKQWLSSVASHTTPTGNKEGPYKVLALSPKEIEDDSVDRIYVQFTTKNGKFAGYVSMIDESSDDRTILRITSTPMEAVDFINKIADLDPLTETFVKGIS